MTLPVGQNSGKKEKSVPCITFNAFGFLQKKLRERNLDCCNVSLEIKEQETAGDLMTRLGLSDNDVEAVFINGGVSSFQTTLKDGDRVAFVPPGTPGPYRVLLGIRDSKKRRN
ncbi:MoaD/ThiS family protein [Desulfohalobiaceae bacterium Ax17]|nr:MoaD/ThiS family protein [Desulfovulcanus ferrireducens]MBT8763728.1 MoaD/ThiS family protein [Desulfovulcanus ferrireducens]